MILLITWARPVLKWQISCFSRTDQKDFFLKPIEKKTRINFNDLLPIEDGAIFCEHGNNQTIGYRLEALCTYKSFQKCDVKLNDDTIQTIEIDLWYVMYAIRHTYLIIYYTKKK